MEGYRVIAVARSESTELHAAIESVRSNASGALAFRACDLSFVANLGHFIGTLRKEFGPIYGLVNNAGSGTSGLLSLMRDDQLEALVHLNMVSPLVLTKHVLRSMMTARAGRIVNMASIVAATGYSGLVAYSATKSGLLGFTRSLAREVGSLGITVNAVAPGFIDTQMTQELTGAARDRIIRRSALKRLATDEDIAGAVSYLLSDRARNITGTTLTVDAGSTA